MGAGKLSDDPSTSASPRPVVNAMTVDVEDWFQVQAFAKVIERDTWPSREYRVEANTRLLLQLFAEHDVRATFFVLGWVAQRSPGLVREIQSAGHEIACHGWSHRLVFEQSPDEFREETVRAKHLLENVAGVAVNGYRAATYSITHKSLWALDVLLDAGFTYDSSIFPVRHDVYGIPDARTTPGLISAPSGRRIREFPLTTWEIGPLRVPVAGGGYFRLFPQWVIHRGIRAMNRRRAPAVFYLHPWEVDPFQPRVAADWRGRLRHYTGLANAIPRLERLVRTFTFDTVAESLRQFEVSGQTAC